jgi:hypothetical protein
MLKQRLETLENEPDGRRDSRNGSLNPVKDKQRISQLVAKLEAELVKIDEHLRADLRVVKRPTSTAGQNVKMETVDDIQQREDMKKYHEWVETRKLQKAKACSLERQDSILDDEKHQLNEAI